MILAQSTRSDEGRGIENKTTRDAPLGGSLAVSGTECPAQNLGAETWSILLSAKPLCGRIYMEGYEMLPLPLGVRSRRTKKMPLQ